MVIAPNIKNFKKNAMEFSQAYCNIPVCGASRSSFLTGLRPSYYRFNEYFSFSNFFKIFLTLIKFLGL